MVPNGGEMSKQLALETLAAAAEQGVSLIDTADIYGLGRSELLVGEFLKTRSDASQFTAHYAIWTRPGTWLAGEFHQLDGQEAC